MPGASTTILKEKLFEVLLPTAFEAQSPTLSPSLLPAPRSSILPTLGTSVSTSHLHLSTAVGATFDSPLNTSMCKMGPLKMVWVLALCCLIHQGFAKGVNLCGKNSHSDLDCTKGLVCQAGWPSETGNYGSTNITVKKANRKRRTAGIPFYEVDNLNDTSSAEGRAFVVRSNALTQTNPGIEIQAPCCFPTVECFKFWQTIELKGVSHTGRLLIDDLEDWKRAECCWVDFSTPKPWCPNPPARGTRATWFEPPRCAKYG